MNEVSSANLVELLSQYEDLHSQLLAAERKVWEESARLRELVSKGATTGSPLEDWALCHNSSFHDHGRNYHRICQTLALVKEYLQGKGGQAFALMQERYTRDRPNMDHMDPSRYRFPTFRPMYLRVTEVGVLAGENLSVVRRESDGSLYLTFEAVKEDCHYSLHNAHGARLTVAEHSGSPELDKVVAYGLSPSEKGLAGSEGLTGHSLFGLTGFVVAEPPKVLEVLQAYFFADENRGQKQIPIEVQEFLRS